MNWQELNKYFDTTYPFHDRITANNCDSGFGHPLHSVIKLSTSLALKTIESPKQKKLIILLPNRLDSARWISVLCALEIMRQDFNRHSSASVTFRKDQTLFIGKCVVVFEEEYFEPQADCMFMRVKCGEGFLNIPLNRKLEFKPADTRRQLSPCKKVLETYKSAKIIDSRLDKILGIKSLDNMAMFHENLILISKIGATESFIKNTCINGSQIIDMFIWGKLDSQGNLSKLKTEQVEAKPSCIISSDLFGASHYIADNPDKTKCVIIDSSAGFINHLQILDDEILKRNIPTIVIADFYDCESLHHLVERDFTIWQWNNKNITFLNGAGAIPRASPFYSLNNALSNYCSQKIIIDECLCPDLSDSIRDIRILDKITSDIPQLKETYGQLVYVILELSRMVRISDKQWIDSLENRIQNIRKQFSAHSIWLSEDVVKLIDNIFRRIHSFQEMMKNGNNPKAYKLNSLINNISAEIYLIVPKIEDIAPTEAYWKSVLLPQQLSKIHFLSISNSSNIERTAISPHVILCGWMGHDKMFSFFYSHLFSEISLLLYPFEKGWYGFARSRWDKQNNYCIRAKEFSSVLGIPEDELHIIEHEVKKPIKPPEKDEFDIFDFELKIRAYRYAGYAAARPGDEVTKARLIVFTQNKFSFITESHRLLVITDIIKGKSFHQEIPRKNVSELQNGDYVIFRESDKDIIREIADKGLENQGLSDKRQTAGLWKKALLNKYISKNKNIEQLSALLQEFGCKRTFTTLRKWLSDDDIIGPKYNSDIEAIAKATADRFLNENLIKVKEAISVVRGAHLQASAYITKKLSTVLPGIIDTEQEQIDFSAEKSVVIDLDEYGKVNILRIEDIGKDTMDIEVKWVNRLLTKEDR